ncbi:putative AAA domain-containing protein [Metarhizium anisopliae]
MVSKRKRVLEDFDPNKSDSEDENFDPSEARAPRNPKKVRPSRGPRPSGGRKRSHRYRGSDIDEDDEILSDSLGEDSFAEDESEDQDAPVNAAGRRTRKAARTHHSYRESSADEEAEDVVNDSEDAGQDAQELDEPSARRLVKLKVPKGPSAGATRRATRASTADVDDFVELSNSGRHAVASRNSRSRSPETYSRTRRSSRSMKGLHAAPETIDEATQESSNRAADDADEPDELSHDYKPVEKKEDEDEDMADTTVVIADDVAEPVKEAEAVPETAAGAGADADADDNDDDEDDDVPITRRTRSSRAAANASSEDKAEETHEASTNSRRLRRGRSKKSTQEPSSDFEPGDDSEEEAMSETKGEDIESPTPRGRKDKRSARNSRRGADSGDEELDVDLDELNEEARGSLLNGPWGTGAAGGVDSDSSDDEMVHRSSVGGNIGMTPTTGAPAGGLLPGGLGLNPEATPNVGKIKDRKALADADPLGVDMSVDFSKVGGLQGHIDQLKEMVQLPLLYPELFAKFHVTPPRGVLFHGPPGTGKTLLARALANSVGSGGRKISFYMRKGADALSKWVGEAEKQLRLLFEEARKTQPSIIFFDEIDGLAPVRSSKQEQIHASIVSTLLALMDGMDGRGQVIVIGATNRPDNIDPALRRPGRFDREFYFPLPDIEARRSILSIHTKDWGLSDPFMASLAEKTKGYGGADLRALCTEAALNSIQRTYPQIYSSTEKLVVDPNKINIHASDFMLSIKKLIPSSERSATSGAKPLPRAVEPLLRAQFSEAKRLLDELLPRKKKITALEEAMYEQYNDEDHGFAREAMQQEFERSRVFRPRFLIYGPHGMGQAYIASAILHHFEGVHVQNFDLPALLADGRSMEQVIVGLFTEVRRHKPSVIYIPNVDAFYTTLSGTVAYITFKTMLRSIPPTDPVLLLATAECAKYELPSQLIQDLFGFSRRNRMEIPRPERDNRMEYFKATLEYIKKKPAEFPDPENRKKRVLEELPVAAPIAPKPPTKEEVKALKRKDHQWLNALKIQLQPIMDQINRKYKKFRQPVIPQSHIDYLFAESDPNYALAKDARNIGDKERTLKANELLSNVEVDIASIEAGNASVDWEGLHRRQVQRAAEAAEKERKRKTMQSILERVQSDLGGGNDSDSQGPLTLGETVPGSRTTARFQLRSPLSNGQEEVAGQDQSNLSNGTEGAPKEGDVRMSGVDDDTQHATQAPVMGPPAKSENDSTKHTGMTQISQRSAMTALPPGVSPSAVVNDASTTKTSDPSTHRSSNFSTQLTNGNHGAQQSTGDGDQDVELPDTLVVPSQATPSDEVWPHSQAHGLARGQVAPGTTNMSGSQVSTPSQARHSGDQAGDGLIQPSQEPQSQEPHGLRYSGSSASQPPAVEGAIENLLHLLTDGTSGCTIEQLEQINRELMDEIWKSRHEWNRHAVVVHLGGVFNDVISDIEQIQAVGSSSQRDSHLDR